MRVEKANLAKKEKRRQRKSEVGASGFTELKDTVIDLAKRMDAVEIDALELQCGRS